MASKIDTHLAKEIYIFSGLGADERVFKKLDFSGFNATFVTWIVPLPKETIEQYATRLLEQIPTSKPILIGLSFGGIMAIEVAKQMDTEKIILIASVKTKKEVPFYYRFAGQLGLHKLFPYRLLTSSSFLTDWLFGIRSASDKALLRQIFMDTDPVFFEWAIEKVIKWTNQTHIKNLFHIHGTSDRILPLKFVTCDREIENGGHLMTLTKADELSRILHEQIR